MFKILIVEDDTNKLRNIYNVIEAIPRINSDHIEHVVDASSAKKVMRNNVYDLLILDIAIPTRKSDLIDSDGGVKLVQELFLREDNYNIPAHIVGLTALSDVFEKATKDLEASIISVIRYSDTDKEWEEKLQGGISQWIRAKESSSSLPPEYDYDVAILTAVDVEFQAVKSLSDNWTRVTFPGDATPYSETVFENGPKKLKVVAASLSQMGMNASAVLTMKLIYNFRPRYIFMPGIVASLKDASSHGFGDVLIVDECWDGGAGKVEKDAGGEYVFKPTAQHLRLEKDLSEKIRALKDNQQLLRAIKDKYKNGQSPNTELNIHIGSVVSVAGVIANKDVADNLLSKDRKLLGLEMEAYGMYYSANNCSNPKPSAMALKSVSDFANSSKSDSYQGYAAFTSANVMYHFIMNECWI